MVTEKPGKSPVIFRECRLTNVGGGGATHGDDTGEGRVTHGDAGDGCVCVWGDARLCCGLERGVDLENDWIHGASARSELQQPRPRMTLPRLQPDPGDVGVVSRIGNTPTRGDRAVFWQSGDLAGMAEGSAHPRMQGRHALPTVCVRFCLTFAIGCSATVSENHNDAGSSTDLYTDAATMTDQCMPGAISRDLEAGIGAPARVDGSGICDWPGQSECSRRFRGSSAICVVIGGQGRCMSGVFCGFAASGLLLCHCDREVCEGDEICVLDGPVLTGGRTRCVRPCE